MKKVLFLVGDHMFPVRLEQERKRIGDTSSYSLLVVPGAKEAIEILLAEDIALFIIFFDIISDPVFVFLDKIDQVAPSVPCVVLSKGMDEEDMRQLALHGVFRVLDVESEFSMLHQTVLDGIAAGDMGHISGVALPVALQMVELERKTCTVYIKTVDGLSGTLYFNEGELFDAVTTEKEGAEAALEIVGWEDAEIDIQGFCKRRVRVIQEPLTFLLMEGARQKDEDGLGVLGDGPTSADSGASAGYEDGGTVSEFVPGDGSGAGDINGSIDNMDFARAPEPLDIDKLLEEGPMAATLNTVQTALARAIGPIAKAVFRSYLKDWAKEGEPSRENLEQLIDLLCIEIEDEDLIMEFRDELSEILK
jgi:hypothetical protein